MVQTFRLANCIWEFSRLHPRRHNGRSTTFVAIEQRHVNCSQFNSSCSLISCQSPSRKRFWQKFSIQEYNGRRQQLSAQDNQTRTDRHKGHGKSTVLRRVYEKLIESICVLLPVCLHEMEFSFAGSMHRTQIKVVVTETPLTQHARSRYWNCFCLSNGNGMERRVCDGCSSHAE